MKIKKKIVPIFLALTLVFTMMPMVGSYEAQAATSDQSHVSRTVYGDSDNSNISIGPEQLSKGAGEINLQILDYGGREWYVIAYDGKDGSGNEITYQDKDSNTVALHPEGAVALYQKGVRESSPFHDNDNDGCHYGYGYVDWGCNKPSTLRQTIENIYISGDDPCLSEAEQSAIVKRKLTGGSAPMDEDGYDSNNMANGDLDDAAVWPLSVAEASNVPGSILWDQSSLTWLRTPGRRSPYIIDRVYVAYTNDGLVNDGGEMTGKSWGVRPGFYLDMDKVLLTSAAFSGKASGKTGADALRKVSDNQDKEWKVTLKDSRHSTFTVDEITASTCWAPEIHYTNAATGKNEYISAIITDKDGNITYYGRIKSCENDEDASGTASVNLKGKLGSEDRLYVFNEQMNGDQKTDYASELKEIEKTYPMDGGHQLKKTDSIKATCTEPGNSEYWTCTLCGQYFEDKNGENKIEKDSWILDPLGHQERGPYASLYADKDEDGIAIVDCERCDAIFSSTTTHHPVSYELSPAVSEYTGGPRTPSVIVKDADGNIITDDMYTVEYSDNVECGDSAKAKVVFNRDFYVKDRKDLNYDPLEEELTFSIVLPKVAIPAGRKLTYNGKPQTGVAGGEKYSVSGGKATNAGTYTAVLSLNDKTKCTWSDGTTTDKKVEFTIAKAANKLSVKGKTAKVKFKEVKKKAKKLSVKKVIKFSNSGQGKLTYTKNTVEYSKAGSVKMSKKALKKYKKSAAKKILINKKTGKVTLKKGLKKGTYKVKIKVKAAGNANYKASAWKTVTFKIKVTVK